MFSTSILLILLILVAATFKHYGISNDEEVQHVYGVKLISFYLSGFTDRSAFDYINLYLYGGLFDMAAVVLGHALPFDPFETRHLLSGLTGILGVAGVWLLTRRLAGPRAGLIAAALLAVVGPWYGGMFNHTKDVPFATGMIWSLYFLCRIVEEMPRPRLALVLAFGAAVGLTLGIRVGAVFNGFYAVLAIGGWVALAGPARSLAGKLTLAGRIALIFVPGALLAYALMAAFWPWAVLSPLNPLRALSEFSAFRFDIRTLLAGRVYMMYEVPDSYLLTYLAIKMPMLVLAGLGALVVAALPWRGGAPAGTGPAPRLRLFLVAVSVVFPVTAGILSDAPLYTGIRHYLFVVPPLVVLSAIGLDHMLSVFDRIGPRAARAAGLVVVLGLAYEIGLLARLHPHQYVYYNALVGGVRGANDRYDMDYWANTVPEAVDDLEEYLSAEIPAKGRPTTYRVAVCADRRSFEEIAPPNLVWTGDWAKADFFIAPTHMNCDSAVVGRTVAEVERLGVVLAVVKDRRIPPIESAMHDYRR